MAYEEYLQHWGILGMKWGQRNGPPYPLSTSKMNSSEKKQINKSKKPINGRPKSVKEMSDEELDTKLKRLRKEDEYNRLTSPKAQNKSDAQKNIEKMLLLPIFAGATWAISTASKDLAQSGYAYIKDVLENLDLAKEMALL